MIGFWFYSFANLPQSLHVAGCHGQADLDIGFVLDTSSSISHQDFEDAKKFIINTTSFFDIDSGLVRVALITYADVARIRVNWDQSRSQVSLDNMISALNYESGGTETAKALNLASQLFANARRNAVKVGITGLGKIIIKSVPNSRKLLPKLKVPHFANGESRCI